MFRDYRLPSGRQPYDGANGARVGGLVGALLGILPAVLLGEGWTWLIIVTAVIGTVAGFLWERRRIAEDRRRDGIDDGPEG